MIILLIEDNIDDERLTLRSLRKNNILNEVVVACDGDTALDTLFGSNRILPALIVLDLKLPKLSGFEVLTRIRSSEITRLIPVVVMTSSDDPAHVKQAYAAGANSFVRKATEPEEFSEAILQVAMYWILLNLGPIAPVGP